MRKNVMLLLILFLLSFPNISSAASVVLMNKTGFDLCNIYFSPAHQKSWGEDLLGGNTLPDGESSMVIWDTGNQQYWDIMAKANSGNTLYWENVFLENVTQLDLNKKGRTEQGTP